MKKEIIFQIVLFVLFYLDKLLYVERRGIAFSNEPGLELIIFIYHCFLFIIVNYVLIPRLFSKKKYALFFLSIFGLICLFGIVEEGIIEKILAPDTKGINNVTWISIYWYFGEVIVPLLGFMSVKFMFDSFSQQQEMERIKQDKLANELKLLKSQVQPHVLFNSLNNLYNFAIKKSDQVPDLILKLSNVLRYVLYEASEEKVTLIKEITLIKDYVALQEIQYRGRGTINLDIEIFDDYQDIKIAPFLLIPFVENSFKHSFGTIVNEVVIEIIVKVSKENLQLCVKNNFDISEGTSSSLVVGGIGLKNIKQRLELLYPNNYVLKNWNENNMYFVVLKINLT